MSAATAAHEAAYASDQASTKYFQEVSGGNAGAAREGGIVQNYPLPESIGYAGGAATNMNVLQRGGSHGKLAKGGAKARQMSPGSMPSSASTRPSTAHTNAGAQFGIFGSRPHSASATAVGMGGYTSQYQLDPQQPPTQMTKQQQLAQQQRARLGGPNNLVNSAGSGRAAAKAISGVGMGTRPKSSTPALFSVQGTGGKPAPGPFQAGTASAVPLTGIPEEAGSPSKPEAAT